MAYTEAEIQALLVQIDTALIELTTGKVQRYKIGRREFERYEIKDIMAFRDSLQNLAGSIPVEEVTVYDDDAL